MRVSKWRSFSIGLTPTPTQVPKTTSTASRFNVRCSDAKFSTSSLSRAVWYSFNTSITLSYIGRMSFANFRDTSLHSTLCRGSNDSRTFFNASNEASVEEVLTHLSCLTNNIISFMAWRCSSTLPEISMDSSSRR